ncbi:peptidyl serine alpha-galactosyltransferase [Haematococcus lacustris]
MVPTINRFTRLVDIRLSDARIVYVFTWVRSLARRSRAHVSAASKHDSPLPSLLVVHQWRSRINMILALTAVLLLQTLLPCSAEDVHIAYLTDCSLYSDWQTVGMAFSAKITAQPGAITRVMCCTDEQRKRYNQQLLDLMATHVAPSFAINPRTGDNYAAYNKPGAVVDWLAHVTPKEDWVLVLDSDMLMRKVFKPKELNASKGWAVSADYQYLIGVSNDLWKNHIPEVGPRNDTLAGPFGRHADQVGGFFFVHREDLSKMAPQWLKITEDVREDKDAWRLSGDQYVEKGGKPWISEMYGYVYGAAKMDVWHRWDMHAMHYPTYQASGIPKVTHYGLLFDIGLSYKFDKHWHYDFDVTRCPPWDLGERPTGGVFQPPPRPSQLLSKDHFGVYFQQLLALETVATLNAAFCDYHLSHCPPSQQLYDVCSEAISLFMDMQPAVAEAETHFQCADLDVRCKEWASKGECSKNLNFMTSNCAASCNDCGERPMVAGTPTKPLQPTAALKALAALAATLANSSSGGKEPASGVGAQQAPQLPAVTSAAPSSSPPPSPAQLLQAGLGAAAGGSMAGSTKSSAAPSTMKEYLARCYRMTLTVEQVKACVAAARNYVLYEAPPTAASTADDSQAAGNDTAGLRLAAKADGLQAAEHAGAAGTEEEVARRQVRDVETTLDSTTASAPATELPFAQRMTAQLMTWQGGVMLFTVAVLSTLVGMRLRRFRRKQRSGMRSE